MATLGEAVRHLFPNADPARDYRVQDDLDGRGERIAYWGLAAPRPTAQQLTDAATAVDAERTAATQAETTRLAELAAARALVVQTAGTAVGVRFDALTATQVRALAAILFWREGALTATGVVRPLAEWVRQT